MVKSKNCWKLVFCFLFGIFVLSIGFLPCKALEVGNIYNYKVSSAKYYFECNDTLYIDYNLRDYTNKNVQINITSIGDLQGKTMINTTETVGVQTYTTYSIADYWASSSKSINKYFVEKFGSFAPETYVFEVPNIQVFEYPGLPVFASTSKTFYENLMEDDDFSFRLKSYSEKNHYFLIETNNSFYFEDVMQPGSILWNITGALNISVEVNTAQGTVKNLYQKLFAEIHIGGNYSILDLEFAFEDLTEYKDTYALDFPNIGLLFGVVLLVIVGKKLMKRKNRK